MERAALCLGNDSGPMHLAAAADTPTFLQHGLHMPQGGSGVTQRNVLDHMGGEYGLCRTGWTRHRFYDVAVFDLLGETRVVHSVEFP